MNKKDKLLSNFAMVTINDFLKGETLLNYKKVINQLKENFHPSCSSNNCLWSFKKNIYNGEILQKPVLIRTINRLCNKCFENAVSEHDHNLCHKCCNIYDKEYIYHHKNCKYNL